MKQLKKVLNQIELTTVIGAIALIGLLYMAILITIVIAMSLEDYFMSALFGITIFYVTLCFVNLVIADFRHSILMQDLKDIDGLNTIQRSLKNLKQ